MDPSAAAANIARIKLRLSSPNPAGTRGYHRAQALFLEDVMYVWVWYGMYIHTYIHTIDASAAAAGAHAVVVPPWSFQILDPDRKGNK